MSHSHSSFRPLPLSGSAPRVIRASPSSRSRASVAQGGNKHTSSSGPEQARGPLSSPSLFRSSAQICLLRKGANGRPASHISFFTGCEFLLPSPRPSFRLLRRSACRPGPPGPSLRGGHASPTSPSLPGTVAACSRRHVAYVLLVYSSKHLFILYLVTLTCMRNHYGVGHARMAGPNCFQSAGMQPSITLLKRHASASELPAVDDGDRIRG